MKRVRLQDLAEELDLSRATVCLALKGDPRVADDTAERVRKLAHTRGYQPDPVFSALGERRRQQPGEEIIAWVTSHPTESGWRGAITNCTYFEHGQCRAAELGYRLEPFWGRAPGMSGKRFADILYNRGIRGLIFVPPPEPSVELRIPRERFASLALGYSFTAPNNLHRLCPDYFRAARLAITELMRFGCRKIGLVLNRGDMGKSNHGILGAYEGFRVELGGELVSIPFCFVDHMSWNEGAREQVMTWRARHQPDAILTLNAPLDTWCREEGLRVPEDVRIAWINNPRIVRYGGTDLNREDIGRKAVELVAWFLRKQLIGIPEDPLVCMVPPRWIPGNLSG